MFSGLAAEAHGQAYGFITCSNPCRWNPEHEEAKSCLHLFWTWFLSLERQEWSLPTEGKEAKKGRHQVTQEVTWLGRKLCDLVASSGCKTPMGTHYKYNFGVHLSSPVEGRATIPRGGAVLHQLPLAPS